MMRLSDISNQIMQFFSNLADACLEEQYIQPIPIRSQSLRSGQDSRRGVSSPKELACGKPYSRSRLDH